MKISAAKMKVFNNVLSGKIKIISATGHVVGSFSTLESDNSSYQRLKNSFLILKLINKVKRRRDVLMTAKKKIIQIQIDSSMSRV
jgi:hypothetical protein